MNQKKIQNFKSIRFRRWSRAGYAVFCSLACNVTIGCVAGSISEKSLEKTASTAAISFILNNSESETPEKFMANEDFKLAIQQLQDDVLLKKTFESAAACSFVINIY